MTRYRQLCFFICAFYILFNIHPCICKYLDGKKWLVAKKPTFTWFQGSGYSPDENSATAMSMAIKQWEASLETCFTVKEEKKKGAKCTTQYDKPYFCVENGKYNTANMSAGIGPTAGAKYTPVRVNSEYVEAGYTFAANLIGRALGLRSQMEVRPDFNKFVQQNDEALVSSMFGLSESFGAFTKLKDDWSVKDLEALMDSIYGRHCKKTVFSFDYPYDFRSIGNFYSAFGDFGFMLSYDEPAAAYVAKDRENQWMLGYSQLTGPSQMISHYDVYRIMKDYDCAKVFGCKKPPRCRNFGLIDKDCECACAPGYSGDLCEIWTGKPYPRATKAQCYATVADPMILSLADQEYTVDNTHALSDFILGNSIGMYSQWCTIIIQPFGDKRPIIEPIANMFVDNSAYTIVFGASTFLLDWVDCSGLVTAQVLYSNATKRRVLCFSSLYVEDSPGIRPNRSDSSIDITWLWTLHPKSMVPSVFKIKLGINYEPMPPKYLRVFLSERMAWENLGELNAAMRSIGGLAAGAIVGTIVALLLVAGVVGGLFYVQKQKQEANEMEATEVKED